MGMISVIIIFICICVDNMVSSNMTAMKMTSKSKSIFSIKVALAFAGCNTLMFALGYLFSALFFRDWVYVAHNWVAFSFLLLLGIKFMLESIEKTPSFNATDVNNTSKLFKVAAVLGFDAFFVGYAVEAMDTSFLPQAVFLVLISVAMTMLGFRLGSPSSKTIVAKKVEMVTGIILIVMAVRLIVL